ncbi:MAG: alpha/beta hydrolase [Planctomycetota bacterium]
MHLVRWLTVAYLAIVLAMTFIERWLVYPAPPVASGNWTPPGDDYEDVWIDVPPAGHSEEATRVHGWFLANSDADRALLYCHGNGTDISRLLEVGRLLRDQLNVAVLLFDYRGYGKSDGRPIEAGVIADGLAAQRWLANRTGRSPDDVLLVGRSLGGGVATALAAEQGAEALLLQSTFTRITDAAASHYPWLPVRLLMQNRFDSLGRIERYDGPVFISHGTADEVVPFEQSRQLHAAATGFKQFVEFDGRGHNDPQPPSYYDEVRQFLADIRTDNRPER